MAGKDQVNRNWCRFYIASYGCLSNNYNFRLKFDKKTSTFRYRFDLPISSFYFESVIWFLRWSAITFKDSEEAFFTIYPSLENKTLKRLQLVPRKKLQMPHKLYLFLIRIIFWIDLSIFLCPSVRLSICHSV